MARTQMTPKVVPTTKDIGTTTSSSKEIYSVIACQITDVGVRTSQRFGGIQPIVGMFGVRIPSDCVDVESSLGGLSRIRF